jgi:epoxyqueuosine reductase QueG
MKTLTAQRVKELAQGAGADLCGIAPVERFDGAPRGFKPTDIYAAAKSVMVIAKRLPEAVFRSTNPVPYSFASEQIRYQVYRITCELSLQLQDLGVTAVPIPNEPYTYWDAEKMEGRGILSLRHAGYLAGLGVLGRNNLLINERFGNRLSLGALLLDVPLEGDPIATYEVCKDSCSLCIKSCPAKALDGRSVVQKLCRERSQTITPKGYELNTCNICRLVCPNGAGIAHRGIDQG